MSGERGGSRGRACRCGSVREVLASLVLPLGRPYQGPCAALSGKNRVSCCHLAENDPCLSGRALLMRVNDGKDVER